jgi:hypothetical protein
VWQRLGPADAGFVRTALPGNGAGELDGAADVTMALVPVDGAGAAVPPPPEDAQAAVTTSVSPAVIHNPRWRTTFIVVSSPRSRRGADVPLLKRKLHNCG